MSNMSYCRFQNTLEALRECRDALSENLDTLSSLSEEERSAAAQLFRLCKELADDYGSFKA